MHTIYRFWLSIVCKNLIVKNAEDCKAYVSNLSVRILKLLFFGDNTSHGYETVYLTMDYNLKCQLTVVYLMKRE